MEPGIGGQKHFPYYNCKFYGASVIGVSCIGCPRVNRKVDKVNVARSTASFTLTSFRFVFDKGNVKGDTIDRLESLFSAMIGKTITYKELIKRDTEENRMRAVRRDTMYSIVKSGNGGSSRSATGGRTTASPIEDDLPEPTEEDLNRRFMIIENEQGQPQPEMVGVSLAGDLADKDCEEQ